MPYHEELHNILLSKGYAYSRIYDLFEGEVDLYIKDGRRIIFSKSENLAMNEANGEKSSWELLMKETNNIFDPDQIA
jgi:hypothetical protein